MNEFRRLLSTDRPRVLEISSRIWEGDDYIPRVFDYWLGEGYFYGLFVNEILVGFGRLCPFDKTRGWLHGLRVAQEFQGKGYGRVIVTGLLRTACEIGMEELFFSTYFGNVNSIRLNESLGFRMIAEYTNLEYEMIDNPPLGELPLNNPSLEFRSESWDSWMWLPPDLKNSADFLRDPYSFELDGMKLRLADNIEYGKTLDIANVEACDPLSTRAIDGAISVALMKGKRLLHLMLPSTCPLEPFLKLGFRYWERPCDVFLYHCKISDLEF